MTNGQVTMLALFNEYDVKGTLSGKLKIFGHDGRPVDALGYMLVRLGYQGTGLDQCKNSNGEYINPYVASAQELGTDREGVRRFYREIDRTTSTNATIKQMFHSVTGLSQ